MRECVSCRHLHHKACSIGALYAPNQTLNGSRTWDAVSHFLCLLLGLNGAGADNSFERVMALGLFLRLRAHKG